ncbi:MAG: hypothetical protein IT348_15895, partial [Candidatus Eisenbacteria bacterium]|nr:hypothetical protein [Candidatus Eisenbacteria bacterium]
QLVELVRDMIVMDVRDTIDVAAGGDLSWWAGTTLMRMPTRFGTLDLKLTRPAPGRLVASWSDVTVPLRVRVPDGVRLDAVEGAAMPERGSRWVTCGTGQNRVALQVTPL